MLLDPSRSTRKLERAYRWKHTEQLDDGEPKGCGFPVCAVVDMRTKRFKSMCAFVAWMREEGRVRQVIEVQKGGCEDASEIFIGC